MAPREADRILPLALALAAVAAVSWARGPPDARGPGQGCSALGRCCPGRDPTCAARGPPRCFCDQACGAARDCCADYSRACPAVSCVVAEWSGWSRCAKPCQVSYRVRRRHVLQEPRNGGAPCPHLEEQAGCVEYRSHQGVECQQSLCELGGPQGDCQILCGVQVWGKTLPSFCPDPRFSLCGQVPALITTGRYGKERKKQSVPKGQEIFGYCVQFQLGPIPGSCRQVRAPHAQWTKYLTQGHLVCVRCEWPAQDARSRRCHGDGGGARENQLLLWQAAGHPRCRGTWERLGQLPDCSCPEVHSLIFI